MQLHKALCKLLWVSHKALVSHPQEQVQRGTGKQTGARASLWEHREREEGKFSIYTAWTVGPAELLALKFSTTDTRVGSPLTEAE